MKNTLTILTILLGTISCYAQTYEEITNKGFKYTDTYHIDKKSKSKEGTYLKVNNNSRDTLITGNYDNNRKVGLWKYNSSRNKPYLYYDYSNKEIKVFPRDIAKIDTFLVKSDSAYELRKVDRAPAYLGYKSEIRDIIQLNGKVPVWLQEQGITGSSLYTFVVDSLGKMVDIRIEKSLDKEFDREILNSIKLIDGEWLPAIVNGKPVDSKFFILATISKNQAQKYYFDRDNLIVINFVCYEIGAKLPTLINSSFP